MKKAIIFVIISLSAILLISCSNSPQEKLVGVWGKYENGEWKGTWTFESSGSFSWSTNLGSGTGVWRLEQINSNEATLYTIARGVSKHYDLIFLTDNEINIGSRVFKRQNG